MSAELSTGIVIRPGANPHLIQQSDWVCARCGGPVAMTVRALHGDGEIIRPCGHPASPRQPFPWAVPS